jgi:erythromycin esterase
MRGTVLFLLLLATASPALPLDLPARGTPRPQSGIWPLLGDDPALPLTHDLEPLRQMIGDADVVGLGETYHTSGGFYRMKHRLFRFLVQEMGFRAFAMETNWQAAERTTTYVQTCAGTAEQAIAGHISVWIGAEYADLVRWMCEWNRSHPRPEDKVVFFAFDIQQPRDDGPALFTFLDGIGIPPSDPRAAGIRLCEGVVDRHPFGQVPQDRHDACIESLAAIEQHLTANRSDIVRRTSQRQYDVAMLRVIGLRAWENSVFTIAHDFEAGYNARDEGMAYAFHALRAMKAPGAKTVVWAANSHVARTPLPRGERPLGSYLETAFGDDYVTFALTAFDTDVDYPGFRCGRVIRTPGSVEERLAKHGEKALLVDTRTVFARSRGVHVMGVDHVRPHRNYDGIIYLEHSPKMQPLIWTPCVP